MTIERIDIKSRGQCRSSAAWSAASAASAAYVRMADKLIELIQGASP